MHGSVRGSQRRGGGAGGPPGVQAREGLEEAQLPGLRALSLPAARRAVRAAAGGGQGHLQGQEGQGARGGRE